MPIAIEHASVPQVSTAATTEVVAQHQAMSERADTVPLAQAIAHYTAANPASRAALVAQLQQTRGNAYVQKVIAGGDPQKPVAASDPAVEILNEAVAWNKTKAVTITQVVHERLTEMFGAVSFDTKSRAFAEMIMDAQKSLGLPVDGKFGAGTAKALRPMGTLSEGAKALALPSLTNFEESDKMQSKAYDDGGGHLTIGWGFDLAQGDAADILKQANAPGTVAEYKSGALTFDKDLADRCLNIELMKKKLDQMLIDPATRLMDNCEFSELPDAVQALMADIGYHRGGAWFTKQGISKEGVGGKFAVAHKLDKKGGVDVGALIKAKDYTGAARAMMETDYSMQYGQRYFHAVACLEAFGKGHFALKTAKEWGHDYEVGVELDGKVDKKGRPLRTKTISPVAGFTNEDFPITVEAMTKYWDTKKWKAKEAAEAKAAEAAKKASEIR